MSRFDILEFKKIFGRKITDFAIPFEHMTKLQSIALTGLDITKFDEWINPPEGTSYAEEIRKRYGLKAQELIERLI